MMQQGSVRALDEYPQGLFLWIIINQINFDSGTDNTLFAEREGANVDEANLRDVLKHFEIDLRVWRDLTLNELLRSLNRLYYEVDSDHNKYAGLVFLCMSHGKQIDGKDFLVTKDNKYLSCEKVVDIFHNCFCYGLKNRPKFYFFNCCRGGQPNAELQKLSISSPIVFDDDIIAFDHFQSGVTNTIGSNDTARQEDEGVVGFKKGDYVIVHSTIKDYLSMRHKENGSIFVYELSQQLHRSVAKQEGNLEDIVRQACMSTSKQLPVSQLPEMTTTLRAPCHLVIKGS